MARNELQLAVNSFKSSLEKMEPQFAPVLPAHIPPERFIRVVTTAVQINPDLLSADRRSLFMACLRAAESGLVPDGVDAALVVFDGRVVFMPMVNGLLKLVRQSGELSTITAHIRYENDEWEYELGDNERIYHKPADGDRGKPMAAYAIAKLKDGGIVRAVLTLADIQKRKAVSRAGRKGKGPWVEWYEEMAKKSALRAITKYLPRSTDRDDVRLHQALHADDALFADSAPQITAPKDLEGDEQPENPGIHDRVEHDDTPTEPERDENTEDSETVERAEHGDTTVQTERAERDDSTALAKRAEEIDDVSGERDKQHRKPRLREAVSRRTVDVTVPRAQDYMNWWRSAIRQFDMTDERRKELQRLWNAQRAIRNRITWEDDNDFILLRDEILEFLEAPAA